MTEHIIGMAFKCKMVKMAKKGYSNDTRTPQTKAEQSQFCTKGKDFIVFHTISTIRTKFCDAARASHSDEWKGDARMDSDVQNWEPF